MPAVAVASGPPGPPGPPPVRGAVATTAELPLEPEPGYLYYVQDTGHAWTYHFEDDPQHWEDLGDFTGNPGDTGPSGLIGPQGPQGGDGPIGPVGPQGVEGPSGPQGVEGPVGLTGPTGAAGTGINMKGSVATSADLPADASKNKTGDAYIVTEDDSLWIWDNVPSLWISGGSIQGPPGSMGPQGSQGPTGSQGPQGVDGAIGPQGTQGPQGLQGPTGLTGSQGPQGVTGPQGSPGAVSTVPGPQGLQGDQGTTGASGTPGATGAQGVKGDTGATGTPGAQGPQGIQGPTGTTGAAGATGAQGVQGPSGATALDLLPPWGTASAAATNLAADTFNAVSDMNFRRMIDLRGITHLKIMGRIGGSLVAATKLRIQYHTAGNVSVATADAGWTTLADTAGSHTLSALFYTAELAVPAGAQINDCLVRVGLFSGNGAADPTITACCLNFYS